MGRFLLLDNQQIKEMFSSTHAGGSWKVHQIFTVLADEDAHSSILSF